MNKKIFFLILPPLIILIYIYFQTNHSQQNPLSSQQQFSQQLKHALYLGRIKSGQILSQPSLGIVHLTLKPQDNPTLVTIISLQKDPYHQISTLQQIIKKAKIKHKIVLFADLSLDNPYATLTNP